MVNILLAAGFFAEWAAAWVANIGGLTLVVIGMILVIVEMFIPGFGAAGISGAVALIVGLVIGSETVAAAMFSLLIIVLLLVIFAVVIFRSALRGRLSRSPVVLNTSIEAGSTELFNDDMQKLIGKKGIAVTALRPAGIANIEGKRLDVVSKAEYIDKGCEIVIDNVEGVRILVRKA